MRPQPKPAILCMHNWQPIKPSDKPNWGPFGSWMYWTWAQMNPSQGVYNWATVDAYLDAAEGRPVALSVLVYPDLNQDCAPKWVYGSGGGWPIVGGVGTFPRWNDATFDAALHTFIAAFGARYDGDPRIHSVWITFARYGETVTDGLGSDLHNPGRYFRNVVDWYDAAFPTTPLAALITGQTDRLALAELCWSRGIMVKFNSLCRDLPNHKMLKPTPGGGHAELAQRSTSKGLGTGWEHFYPENAPETYWAIITFLSLGGTLLDLPAKHLDALAAIPGLWDWALEVMECNVELAGVYVARNTTFPPPGNGYEHGYPGPWERGISTNATCYSPNSAAYKAAPASLTATLEGYGGIGYADPDLTITSTLPAGEYDVEVVYAPKSDTGGWSSYYLTTLLPGTFTVCTEPCWVHRVTATPYEGEPEPEPPDPTDELAGKVLQLETDMGGIEDSLTTLTLELGRLGGDANAQAARIAALESTIALLDRRLAPLERALQAVKAA